MRRKLLALSILAIPFLTLLSRADVAPDTAPVGVWAPPLPDTAPVSISAPSLALTPDPATPSFIQRISDTYHVLDNLTPLTFFDAHNGTWCAGGVTTLYKKYYVSADAGLAAPLISGTKGEFAGGLRAYFGELLLDQLPGLRTFMAQNNLTSGLLKYAAAGAMISYDWTPLPNQKSWRYGPYVGFEVRIK